MSAGFSSGVVYMLDYTESKLWISHDFFDNYYPVDTFNFAENYITGIEGGKTDGEFYILYSYHNYYYESSHIFIYHSVNYGKSFGVFTFLKKETTCLANFSIDKEVNITEPVEFSNFSIGDIQEYQWDFE
ncbi:MAG: hypothetical protein R2764_14820 [Bacteroidales bacterium]